MNTANRIGFMQGRLSPLIDGRIQSFPWSCWQEEFVVGGQHGLNMIEWTLDQEKLYENPLLTADGRAEIKTLCRQHGIVLPSLTGDCFMQAPFWKATGSERDALQKDFIAIAEACADVGISMMVVPLVDNGGLENAGQEDDLVAYLKSQAGFLAEHGLRVVFESDFAPEELARFIDRLDPAVFGINYDIGNSAALGYNPNQEIAAYGQRIVNVHVKDRMRGGTTVPPGSGDADFETVFAALAGLGYAGNWAATLAL